MTLSYRTRRAFLNMGITLLAVVLVAVLALAVWLLWLDRFVVYSDRGARLDFSRSTVELSGEVATAPAEDATVSIYFSDEEQQVEAVTAELTQIIGYYISTDMLINDMEKVRQQVGQLPAGAAVLVDMKSPSGRFHYNTQVSTKITGNIDLEKMDALLSELEDANLYLIARVPAFQDYYYALDNIPDGMPVSGGALWLDDTLRTYWLKPSNEGTLEYLTNIGLELRAMGFNEVVFGDFGFPASERVAYEGDRAQALKIAAETLVEACATDRFAVSFGVRDIPIALPEGRCRLYLSGVEAADAEAAAQQSGVADAAVELVFLSQTNDTRFDAYSVLRPITEMFIDTQ